MSLASFPCVLARSCSGRVWAFPAQDWKQERHGSAGGDVYIEALDFLCLLSSALSPKNVPASNSL